MFGSMGTLFSLYFLIKLYSTLGPEQIQAKEEAETNEESGEDYAIMMDSLNNSSALDALSAPPHDEEQEPQQLDGLT